MSATLTLNGFLGYRYPVSLLLDDLSYGIAGQDTTGDGTDSNGVGKSAICDGLAWVFFGKVPRRVDSVDELIHTGSELMEAGFQNSRFHIQRSRKRGASQKVVLWDGDQPVPARTVAEAQEFIDKQIVGLSYDDFMNFVYFTGTATKTFLSPDTDPAERGAVVSRYLKSEVYDDCRAESAVRLRDTQTKIEVLDGRRLIEQQAAEHRQNDLSSVAAERQMVVAAREQFFGDSWGPAALLAATTFWEDFLARMQPVVVAVDAAKAADVESGNAATAVTAVVQPDRSELLALEDRYESLERGIGSQYAGLLRQWLAMASDLESGPVATTEVVVAVSAARGKELQQRWTSGLLRGGPIDLVLSGLRKQQQSALTCPACSATLMQREHQLEPLDVSALAAEIEQHVNLRERYRSENEQFEADHSAWQIEHEQLLGAVRAAGEHARRLADARKKVSDTRQQMVVELETCRTALATVRQRHESYTVALTKAKTIHGVAVQRVTDLRQLALAAADEFDRWLNERMVIQTAYAVSREQPILVWLSVRSYNQASQFFTNTNLVIVRQIVASWKTGLKAAEDSVADYDRKIAAYDGQITELSKPNDALDCIDAELACLRETAGHLTFWKTEFPAIRDRIISRFLPLFESVSNRNLAELKVVHRVRFNLTAETQSGKTVPRFSISVWDGTDWRSSHTYSVGQWGRIALSICFAFRELMLRDSTALGSRMFLCDEVADRFDQTGLRLFIELVQRLDGLRLIVSHRPASDLGGLDRIITVIKDATTTSVQII